MKQQQSQSLTSGPCTDCVTVCLPGIISLTCLEPVISPVFKLLPTGPWPQATTSQAEGMAILTSQVQQLMAAFTIVTPVCMNIVFVMNKQWKPQNSNNKTHLRFRSWSSLFPSSPLHVSLLLSTCKLKSLGTII